MYLGLCWPAHVGSGFFNKLISLVKAVNSYVEELENMGTLISLLLCCEHKTFLKTKVYEIIYLVPHKQALV